MSIETPVRVRSWTNRRVLSNNPMLRLLVIDDEVSAAEALTALLIAEGFNARAAIGGYDGVSAALDWSPHIVISDISMPECTGFQAALAIRSDPRSKNVCIIAFTALNETDVLRERTDHEFDAYCQKGQPPALLIALIHNMVEPAS